MKRISLLLLIGGIAFFQACVGPVGPPGPSGPQGPQGQPGVNIVAEVFEVDANFTPQNEYQEVWEFRPPIFNSDVVMVYVRWGQDSGNTLWRALPQTVLFEEGILVYNFDFTRADFSIFLQSNFDPSILDSSWTRNQKFRIVVIPGEFSGARLDLSDYEAVMKYLGKTEKDIKTLYPKS